MCKMDVFGLGEECRILEQTKAKRKGIGDMITCAEWSSGYRLRRPAVVSWRDNGYEILRYSEHYSISSSSVLPQTCILQGSSSSQSDSRVAGSTGARAGRLRILRRWISRIRCGCQLVSVFVGIPTVESSRASELRVKNQKLER